MTHALHLIILWIYMTTLTFTPNWTIVYLHNEVLIIRLFTHWNVHKWVWNIHWWSFFFLLFFFKSGFHILISGNHLCHELLNTSCDSGSDKPNDIFFSLFLIRNCCSFPSPASPTWPSTTPASPGAARNIGPTAPWTWRGGSGWAARSPACRCHAAAPPTRATLWTTSTSTSSSPAAWGARSGWLGSTDSNTSSAELENS